jgi:hypothetical protein
MFFLFVVLLIVAVRQQDTTDMICMSLAIVLLMVVLVLLLRVKLELYIDEEGIRFRYIPSRRQLVSYTWNQVASVEVLSVNPLSEFRGWGRKYSKKYGPGYLTQGDYILHVVLKDGSKISFTVLDRRGAAAFLAGLHPLPAGTH